MTIHVNSIMEKIRMVLDEDPDLVDFNVQVGQAINMEQDRLPWIGIWPGALDIEGHAITNAAGLPWQADLQIQVFHQGYSERKDSELINGLMIDQQLIITAVSSNVQLDKVVLMLKGVGAAMVDFDERTEENFITNLITLSYEVRG